MIPISPRKLDMIQFSMSGKRPTPEIDVSFFKNKNADEIAIAMCRKCKGDRDLAISKLVHSINRSDIVESKIREAIKIIHDMSKQEELNNEVLA